MLEKVIRAFLPEVVSYSLRPIGSGLIHHTWRVDVSATGAAGDGVGGSAGDGAGDGAGGAAGDAYVLQEVNTGVFTNPRAIAENLEKIGRYLAERAPRYLFAAPLCTADGAVFYRDDCEVYFRMFPFVAGSRTYDVVHSPEQAYEASRQFGLFTRQLQGFEVGQLQETLPRFHDLELRYEQFDRAVHSGGDSRVRHSMELIEFLQGQRGLVDEYIRIKGAPEFSLRVTHHDTKISNVLFDEHDKGLCVIDLDTVMPGYFISDVGDMIRTYVSPASEEEMDLKQVVVRREFYQAIYDGYLGVMGEVLSPAERGRFFYGGLFMVYMQALRFLTDHLNGDVYYGARYEGQNYVRAANQVALLKRLMEL